ncbi:SGNH/GDSL hydrolase family protein [Nocardioides sp. cx-173]|uniref:SGNH/GDSL hydrolase family protein n=1 Tax=Nocardioides sp. cx-173 TaxID=2898796 RepID=UPI001E2A78F8|nr:SGNH/GDSL hydrolase family protein [Nocardioides sp. cx-173]MCD4526299.1 GDSL-type esterase/lipase family protein [Nocardioides sp. cx-173]UGB43475.1 GDSL-type esterase/lipase family protein [Nocardioides sp. cx-173]
MSHQIAALLRGAVETEPTPRGLRPHRLPALAREQAADPQLSMAEEQPSGVRLAFRTSASLIELDVVPTKRDYAGAPPRPDGVYDLVVDGRLAAQATAEGGDVLSIDLATGATEHRPGEPVTLRFDGLGDQAKDVEIWLPHDEATLLVDLRADAVIEPSTVTGRPVWVHHGSSISHGSNAAHPTGTWPALAARLADAELVNLGFSGSALLDPFAARTIRDLPAEAISLKIGINLVNADVMRLRAFRAAVHGFLDTVRDGHPTTPLLVVSPILCPIHEQTPGPSAMDVIGLAAGELRFSAAGDPAEVAAGKLTLEVIRAELGRIVAQRALSDPHLHLLDGRELYGEQDHAELPLPDDLHPDAAAHRRMGERFARLAFGPGGPLGT